MKLRIENLYTTAEEITPEEVAWLSEYLTYTNPRGAFIRGRWKAHRHCYFSAGRRGFPTGLASAVAKAATVAGVDVAWRDARTVSAHPDLQADLAWLRPYQRDAVTRAIGRTRGVLWLPTGAGKTEIAVGLAVAVPCQWLFLVHRKSLLQQTRDRFLARTGEEAGLVGAGAWDPRRFTVATFQTLARLLKKRDPRTRQLLRQVQGLIVDECHVQSADSHMLVTMATPNAYYRIGMSGTPLARGDKRSVATVAALGPIIYQLPATELIDAGALVKPQITMLPCYQEFPLRGAQKKYATVYKRLVVQSHQRNAVVLDAVKAAPKPALIFVQQVKHGHTLTAYLREMGIAVDYVHGKLPEPTREALKDALQRGALDALVCTVVYQEGVDIPDLRSVIIATGGKSSIAALQRVGRGMRPSEGKDEFVVYDIDDQGEPWMARHSKARARAYADAGYQVMMGAPGARAVPLTR